MRVRAVLTAIVLLAIGVSGCGAERDRPDGSDLTGPLDSIRLEVTVLSPQTGNGSVYYAGESVTVAVRASEAAGALVGTGFVARRVGPEHQTLDSAAVSFEARKDTTAVFPLALPDTMPHRSQLDIFGIAYGPDTLTAQSVPQTVVIHECPANADYC